MLVIGTPQTASAHKSEVIGDYKIEVGWEKEPPLVGVENKIVVIITYAFPHEKTDSTSPDPKLVEKYGKGISGLETKLDVSVTLNKEKTPLTMTETSTAGLYAANFAPRYEGYPIVHVFVTVDETPIEIDFHPERVEDGAIIQTTTSDGSLNAQILATAPQPDRRMLIMLEFTDKGNLVEHVNYDILATQNEIEILSKTKLHSEDGLAKHTTMMLNSSEPAQVQLKILGIGLPGDESNWTGPVNEVITIQVVPEFDPLWVLILASIMGSTIIITKNVKRSV